MQSLTLLLLGLGLIGTSTGYLLLWQTPVPKAGVFGIDIGRMREVARRDSTALPERIESLVVGETAFPAGAVRAGDSLFTNTPIAFVSYRIVYANRSVILDTALDRSTQEKMMKGSPFYDDRYEAMQSAMNQASRENGLILLTHEHSDHIGGLAHSQRIRDLAGISCLTPEQLNSPSLSRSGFPEEAKAFFTPYAYDGLSSPAAGIVLAKAKGHSPGSQLVYVALKNGKEFLFVGDIAWNRKNIDDRVGRPLLMSLVFLHEDRQAVANQLDALHTLHEKEPGLRIIAAHDGRQLDDLRLAGDISEGFTR